ncbi:MAG: PhoU domain-containing protein, partial [Paeniclostridium sordellii]|nr:PhoU domain-containing protein [Paeniclostridium sordellii]
EVAIQNKTKISDSAKSELIDIYSKVLDAYELSLDAMKQNNSTLANDVLKIEDEVDALDKLYRAKHMNRLNSHSCSIDSGIMYLDLLTNLERISDHSASIAKRVIKINQTS